MCVYLECVKVYDSCRWAQVQVPQALTMVGAEEGIKVILKLAKINETFAKNLGIFMIMYHPFSGAESPEAVRKLMSLSEKVRPHNNKKDPLPAHHNLMPRSPLQPNRQRRVQRTQAAPPVHLNAESSSVLSVTVPANGTGSVPGLKKSATTGRGGSCLLLVRERTSAVISWAACSLGADH